MHNKGAELLLTMCARAIGHLLTLHIDPPRAPRTKKEEGTDLGLWLYVRACSNSMA